MAPNTLLLARCSGARRGEIARLSFDCLDCYPDGTARLRLPTGKTRKERLVPLNEEAAGAVQTVQALRANDLDRGFLDEDSGILTRYLFVRHGKPLSTAYLFERPLRAISHTLGLVGPDGRHKITAHRFRHTVGTQLAERGAKLHTIMAMLGHYVGDPRSPALRHIMRDHAGDLRLMVKRPANCNGRTPAYQP